MSSSPQLPVPNRAWSAATWCLRLIIVVQAYGIARKLLLAEYETESDIYSWLYFDLDWAEPTALWIEDRSVMFYLAAALLVLVLSLVGRFRRSGVGDIGRVPAMVWQSPLLLYIGAWQLLLAALHTLRGGSFMPNWTLGEHAVRYAAPLALLLLLPLPGRAALGAVRANTAINLLRIAAAATFLVHGTNALLQYSNYITLIVASGENLLGWSVPQPVAETALLVIGAVDVLVAILLVFSRSRSAAMYMAFWGFITAASRTTAMGSAGISETLLRAANGGVPLAILIYWLLETRSSSGGFDETSEIEEKSKGGRPHPHKPRANASAPAGGVIG